MATKKETPVKKAVPVVYIGPTLKGVVRNGTVFSNGLTKELDEECKKNPLLLKMIVNVTDLAKSKHEVNSPGSVLNILYKTILKEGM